MARAFMRRYILFCDMSVSHHSDYVEKHAMLKKANMQHFFIKVIILDQII